ncbi:RNA polymerase sigma factor [Nannocystis radixulma]|uniref:Sigma-70 family RNA polymerase sigma factor n=1 Tax=Nannocystis radixulma TaxID=2995305 RepID=A0ABT5BHY0_9BACT|nr:sigma-70 family RNA polymerase sigma factor [Nannocystis radixulma]MDC0673707.1 sigma-70 family RNA polymerase sigma factor [Nannocystis radixulma]
MSIVTETAGRRTQGNVMADALLPAAPRTEPGPPDASVVAGATSVLTLCLESLFREHHDFVWRSARRLGCPPSHVDDAVQEVFVIAARKMAEIPPSKTKGWLFCTTRHVVRNYRRGHTRRENRETAACTFSPTYAPDPSSRYDAACELLELLESLDEERRVIFVLATLEQMTAPQIAAILGIKLNTVYSRLRLAREELKQAVADRRRTP